MDKMTSRLQDFDSFYRQLAKENQWNCEVEDGQYQVRINRVYLKESYHRVPQLEWELEILGTSYAGCLLYKQNSITKSSNSLWQLRSDLKTCGVILNLVSELENPQKIEPLAGMVLLVQVLHTENGQKILFQKKMGMNQNDSEDTTVEVEP